MIGVIVVILVLVVVGITIKSLFAEGKQARPLSDIKDKPKKHHQEQKKPLNMGATTALAGAALVHQMRKHHRHDDFSDIDDKKSGTWDDEFDDLNDSDFYDDLDIQAYEDSDYEYERAAYEEEQAAYEDFIASVDLADD